MYAGIKRTDGLAMRKTAPLKSASGELITDVNLQMERWVENYSDLYKSENQFSNERPASVNTVPLFEELDLLQEIKKLPKDSS